MDIKRVCDELDTIGMKVVNLDAEKALRSIYPENKIRAAFLKRADIAALPKEQQDEKWEQHRRNLDDFMKIMSGVPLRSI